MAGQTTEFQYRTFVDIIYSNMDTFCEEITAWDRLVYERKHPPPSERHMPDALVLGGLPRRGFTTSDVNIGENDEMTRQQRITLMGTIRDKIKERGYDYIVLDHVSWDWAIDKISGIRFTKGLLPYYPNVQQALFYREAKEEIINMIGNFIRLPRVQIRQFSEQTAKECAMTGKEPIEVLNCISGEIHEHRDEVYSKTPYLT